jgi:hypothetical protein
MKKIITWAFASATVAILAAGCTTDTTSDTSEGGVTTGTSGTAGSAGSAGAGGSATAGSSGAGGTASETDGGAAMMSDCEKCAYAKCNGMMEVDKCEADKTTKMDGCGDKVDAFYDCLKTADTTDKVMGCEADFASQVSGMGMSQDLANTLAGCVDQTGAMGCLTECGATAAGGGSDAGTD